MKKGNRVILNPKGAINNNYVFADFQHDEYNPFDCKGTILTTENPNPKGWSIIVLWDNGLQNSYSKKSNLIIVDDEC